MTDITLTQMHCRRYRLPFIAPVQVGGQVLRERTGLLVCLRDSSGNLGWGEAAPLPGLSRETLEDVEIRTAALARAWTGQTWPAERVFTPEETRYPALHFALSFAWRQLRDPLHADADAARQNRALSLCALVDGGPEEARRRLQQAAEAGYAAVKIKVGRQPMQEDLALIREARQTLPASCQMRLDANRCWNRMQFLDFCAQLGPERIAFIEEPLPLQEITDFQEFYQRTGIPYAVDETLQELSCHRMAAGEMGERGMGASGGGIGEKSILDANDGIGERGMGTTGDGRGAMDAVRRLRQMADAAQVWVWKPSACLPPEQLGLVADRPVILSGAYESGVGTAAILEYALDQSPTYPVGVDTYARLENDLLLTRLPLDKPTIQCNVWRECLQTLDPRLTSDGA